MRDKTRGPRPSVLSRLQQGMESVYRVNTELQVDLFLVDEDTRRSMGVARTPREQLLVTEDEGDLHLGLFLDARAINSLEAHDPAGGLHEANFGDFCLAVEGVSHFIYLAVCAARQRRVSALELELQAEVDKFVCCLLVQARHSPHPAHGLVERLYDDVRWAADLDSDERDRYTTANDQARRYAVSLEQRYLKDRRLPEMLKEVRRFYRMPMCDKMEHIGRQAGC